MCAFFFIDPAAYRRVAVAYMVHAACVHAYAWLHDCLHDQRCSAVTFAYGDTIYDARPVKVVTVLTRTRLLRYTVRARCGRAFCYAFAMFAVHVCSFTCFTFKNVCSVMPSMASPPKKKPKVRQLTLFGGFAVGSSVYAKKEIPRTSYELFVDAYVERHEHEGVCRADVVRNAQAKWNEIKSDSGAVEQFISNVEGWKLEQARGDDAWLSTPRSSGSATATLSSVTSMSAGGAVSTLPQIVRDGSPLQRPVSVGSSDEARCFLEAIGISAEKLLTPEVTDQACFMSELREFARVHARFQNGRAKYLANIDAGVAWAKKSSAVKENMNVADACVQKVAQLLRAVADIEIRAGNVLGLQSQLSVQRKAAMLSETTITLTKSKSELADLCRPLEMRNSQVALRLRRSVTNQVQSLSEVNDIKLHTVIGTEKTWVDCFDNVADEQQDVTGVLSLPALVSCGQRIREQTSLRLNDLLLEVEEELGCPAGSLAANIRSAEEQLLAFFPVLSIKRHKEHGQYRDTIVVDAWEFVMPSSHILLDLFTVPGEKATSTTTSEATSSEPAAQTHVVLGAARKPGRKPYHTIFPSLAQCALQYLQQHGWSAQERRRTEVANSVGVSLASLRQHLLKTVPGLDAVGISRTTVHQLMLPPRQCTINSTRYHGVVEARVASKKNDSAISHVNVQHCAAQVNLCMEYASQFSHEIAAFSCDDMNKIHIGAIAVSRYHQIRRFFAAGDEPHYPDHDFPLRNNKIIPSGYMRLSRKSRTVHGHSARSSSVPPRPVMHHGRSNRHRSRSWEPQSYERESQQNINSCEHQSLFVRDKYGRLHYSWPRTGPLSISLRSSKFFSSSITAHCSDLKEIIAMQQSLGKNSVILIVDGGPDWSVRSTVTLMALGYLWKELHLDLLAAVSYAPYNSRFNPIEHAWSPRSNDLTGLVLPATLPGEDRPPSKQPHLSDDQVLEKEAIIHDHAIGLVASYWKDKTFDGHPVESICVPCASPAKELESKWQDKLTAFSHAGVQALKADKSMVDLKKQYRFFVRHIDRRNYLLSFTKCVDDSCNHCTRHPVKSVSSMSLLRQCGGLFTPTPDPRHPGHFKTYLQMVTDTTLLKEKPAAADEFLGHLQAGEAALERCDECKYVFLSAADQLRHNRIAHGGASSSAAGKDEEKQAKELVCSYKDGSSTCGLAFPSYYGLLKHKREARHIMARGRPRKR